MRLLKLNKCAVKEEVKNVEAEKFFGRIIEQVLLPPLGLSVRHLE